MGIWGASMKKAQKTQPDSQGREVREDNSAGKMDYRQHWLPFSTFGGRPFLIVDQRKNCLWKTWQEIGTELFC